MTIRRLPIWILWFCVCLTLALLTVHWFWEQARFLNFPIPASSIFLSYAFRHAEFLGNPLQAFSERGHMLLDTTDYPPLYYAITGFFMVVFGPDISVARLSSFLFVVPLLVIMGRLGWQVAGHRGASLLAIGTATSSWTSLFVRNYDSIPGQMLVLAIILSLALESGNLTRHRVNVCLGLAFGFGMLIKHTVLFLALPPIILAAAPGLFSSRRSVLNFFLTLVLLHFCHFAERK